MSSSPVCDFCGKPEATSLGDLSVCDECYIARGSCCAGEDDSEEPCSGSKNASESGGDGV